MKNRKYLCLIGCIGVAGLVVTSILRLPVSADVVTSEDTFICSEDIIIDDSGVISPIDCISDAVLETSSKLVKMPDRSYDFKSYMDYSALSRFSQKELQDLAVTDEQGFRVLDNRYMVAVGTAVTNRVGDYIVLILENGTRIECIVADIKDDRHTDDSCMVTKENGCVSEFIIDKSVMDSSVLKKGSVSYVFDEWKSKVEYIEVENRNYFDSVE